MNTKKMPMFLLVLGISLNIYSQAWVQRADIGGATRSGSVAFVIDGKIYVGLGWGTQQSYLKDLWEYDPATDIWTQKADFPGDERNFATSFVIGSKGFVGTGRSLSGYYNDLWGYDPANNLWTQKADLPGSPRCQAVGFAIGSEGYIGTGSNGNNLKDFWKYDPVSDSWIQKNDFAGDSVYCAVSFVIGLKAYMGTGVMDQPVREFWEYNPASDSWTQKADFGGTARGVASGFSIGSKGYIGLGQISSSYLQFSQDVWEYDTTANSWTKRESFPDNERSHAIGVSIGSKGYFGCGFFFEEPSGPAYTYSDLWEYNPQNDTTLNSGVKSNENNIDFFYDQNSSVLYIDNMSACNQVSIIDIYGSTVIQKSSNNSDRIIISTKSLKSGTYMIKSDCTNNYIRTGKFVITQ